ncbi:MAG: hypothetical protein M5R36_15620 [Deltaproteobacteria bacterium]|nr:hypothetical protein [Deltaproteobacteria bacterium]
MKRAIVVSIILMAVMPVAARAQTFFTVGQEEGRWWFFDPDGERFFSMGTCVTTPSAFYAPDLGYAPYYQNIINLYGTEQAWSDVVVQRLADWNFNTLGAWSDVNLLGDRVPYTVNLSLSGSNWQYGDVPDYWGQDFLDRVADKMTNEAAPRANDPLLIGWFLDNELRWGPDMRGVKDMFAEYFAFPEDAPEKSRWWIGCATATATTWPRSTSCGTWAS